MKSRNIYAAASAAILLALTACGGNSSDANPDTASSTASRQALGSISLATTVTGTASPVTQEQASRFLHQASFGPTMITIPEVAASGPEAWIDKQFTMPQTLHRSYMDAAVAKLAPGEVLSRTQFLESFWKQASTGEDQLRQRVAFALSEIFVVSLSDANLAFKPRAAAAYYDMLGANCFGNFRTMLMQIVRSPAMGIYLTYIHNMKETGYRVPDENFAREIMQLMTIGLYQLNQDGSLKTKDGQPIETYTRADVQGLAKVFTGWSFYGPDTSADRFWGIRNDPDHDWKPMQAYEAYHSTGTKTFLGVSTSADTQSDATVALDTLFNHPNVGPFIGRQLIQRLVTSNPSPAYISRVAAAFNNNGKGVRGDMRAVIKAILLDPEARTPPASGRGKVREPVVRIANWMRAFYTYSVSGSYKMFALDDPLIGVAQTPLRSPSVFNFFRPNYVPPNTDVANAGLVAPEMQITNETSVVGYVNYMANSVRWGMGTGFDIKSDYVHEVRLAATPDKLMDRLNLLLLNGTMSTTLRNQIIAAINLVPRPTPNATNASAISEADHNRVYIAVLLTMSSPEYLIQK